MLFIQKKFITSIELRNRSIILKLKHILLVLGLSLLPLQYENATAAPRAGIAATVNGEMISTLDLENAIKRELVIRQITKENPQFQKMVAELRKQIINVLVDEKLLLIEAKSKSVSVSEEQLDAEIKNTIKRTGLSESAFYEKVAETGLSEKGYKDKIRTSLITQNLLRRDVLRKIIISDDEVLAFYQSNGGNTASTVEVALIVYPSVDVASRHGAALQSGKSNFRKIAQSVSIGPNADKGGSLGEISLADLAAPIQFQVQKLEAGEVSNIFSLGDNEAQIMLISEGGAADTLLGVMDDATRAQITERLRQQKMSERVAEYIIQLKNKAIINIRD